MDKKERNRIMGVVTFFIGLFLMIFVLPMLITFSFISYFILGVQEFLTFDIIVLAIALFLYTFFMIRPIKTFKEKNNLAILAMIFGGALVVITLAGISMLFSGSLEWNSYLLFTIWVVLPFILLLMLGIILFIHGWHWRKNLGIENNP